MRSTMQDVPLTISSILRAGSTTYGNGIVVTATDAEGGVREATYREVGKRAAQLAHALRRLGITGDERVATFMWNNQEHLEAYLAIPSMGAVLHTLNIRLTPEQLGFIATQAEDQIILVDASLTRVLASSLKVMPTVRAIVVVGEGDTAVLRDSGKAIYAYEEILAAEPATFDWPDIDELSGAAMCYTSGTTGNPKGVVYSHRSTYLHALTFCTGNATGLSVQDRTLVVVPMFHASAWGQPYAALAAGTDLIFCDRFLQPVPLVSLIESQRPTLAMAVPTIWNDLLQWLRAHSGHDISSIKRVVCGGSAVPRGLIQAYRDELGIELRQAWGMTETSPIATSGVPPRGLLPEAELDQRATQGRFIFGVEGRIVDDAGTPLPHDGKTMGEVEVRGPWITGSYYAGADAERFHNGWLRTGDVGTIDELGYLVLTDRAKDVIKSGGEWISSVELENRLMNHPDVVEACVVGVYDEKWQERPLALVVRREGSTISADELRAWLAPQVARWWLPERWSFVKALPRTSVGKFDKKVVRRNYADGEVPVELLQQRPAIS